MNVLLLDLAVRGSAPLLVAVLADLALRRAPAAARALVWNLAVAAVVALPVLAAGLPAWPVAVLAPGSPAPDALNGPVPATPGAARTSAALLAATPRRSLPPLEAHAGGGLTGSQPAASTSERVATIAPAASFTWDSWPSVGQWLTGIWAIGALLFCFHLAAGVGRVVFLGRSARPVRDPGVLALRDRAAARLRMTRRVRLLETGKLRVPVTWELVTPSVAVPTAMRHWSGARQEAVLLHELAHVRRHDCRWQLMAHLAVALHWFNPLAWYALHRLRVERERACDDEVLLSGVRASDYATHLLEIARSCGPLRRQPVAAVAIAWPSQLATRVRAVLDPTHPRRSPDRRTTLSVTLSAFLLLLPLATIEPVAAAPPAEPPVASAAAATSQAQEPTLEQLVQMRIHGVTPEYVESIAAILGATPGIDDLLQFRIHGVTAELVEGMRAVFGQDLDLDDIVSARIHGASPEAARELAQLLGEGLDFDRLVEFRIHGVTPDFVRSMRESFGAIGAEDLVSARIHGVTPDFAHEMAELIEGDLDFDRLIEFRIHGVTAKLVRELREAGYDDLTADELVDIRIHGMDRIMLKRRGNGR